MARITAKSQIKPNDDYTIWFRRKSWPRTGPGSYVIERSYNGHTILYDWDEMKIGKYQGSDGWFVYPRGEDPTQPKARKKTTKRKTTKKQPTARKSPALVTVVDEYGGQRVKVSPTSLRYYIEPKYDRYNDIEKFIVKSITAKEAARKGWSTWSTRLAAVTDARHEMQSISKAVWTDW